MNKELRKTNKWRRKENKKFPYKSKIKNEKQKDNK